MRSGLIWDISLLTFDALLIAFTPLDWWTVALAFTAGLVFAIAIDGLITKGWRA